jgi:hypothetical protein
LVEEINAERDSQKRRMLIDKLRNLGNHRNNLSVKAAGEGSFVVAHRPKDAVHYSEYKPCRFCCGYFAKKSIWKHKCPFAPKSELGGKIPRMRKGAGDLLCGEEPGSVSLGFAGLMNGMRRDEIGTMALKDSLILELGRSLCTKFGGDKDQFNYIRGKMRQIARLLLELRKNSAAHELHMTDFIRPTKFPAIVEAAKRVAGLNEGSSEYHAPSSALKSGGVVRRLAEIKQAKALERSDPAVAEECVQFLKLCQLKWSNEISSTALRNIADRKRTGVLFVPLTEDVVKLNELLVEQANTLALTVHTDAGAFIDMTQVVLAKVILFNRKRQGEVSKMKVEDYRKKRFAQSSELDLALTEFERSLLKVFERVEIRGKRGRTVPLLLTEEMTTWIDKLLAARPSFVPAQNPFLFASKGEYSHLRGSDALRRFAVDCGAKRPELLTSTKLRKQIASLAQVVSLKENELDSLATFMGHDIRIHAQFYRVPSDVVQIAKIGPIETIPSS